MTNLKPAQHEVAKVQLEPEVENTAKPVQMNREVYWLVGGLLVVGLIFLAYKLGKQSVVLQQVQPSPSSVVQTSTDSILSTEKWKTYINQNLGITFKYPEVISPWFVSGSFGYLSPYEDEGKNSGGVGVGELIFSVTKIEKFSARKWYDLHKKDYGESVSPLRKSTVIVDNHYSYKFNSYADIADSEYLLVEKSPDLYIILITLPSDLGSQILSTFKFTE